MLLQYALTPATVQIPLEEELEDDVVVDVPLNVQVLFVSFVVGVVKLSEVVIGSVEQSLTPKFVLNA